MTDPAEGLRLGIVGLGWFGRELARGAQATGDAEVVSCFARSDESRVSFAADVGCRPADSVEALLGDPEVDAVVLATPHSTHVDLTVRAAAAGKHVFVEKPLALNVADADRAIEATDAAGVVLQVGHNRRRMPANRRIGAMIRDGELGTVLQLEGFHSAPGGFRPNLPPWRSDPAECPAGGMTALGIHTVDTFAAWVGRARRVSAFSTRVAGLTDLDEATTVMLEFDGGVLGTIGTSYFTAPIVSVAAFGTEAVVRSDLDGERVLVQRRGERIPTEEAVDTIDSIADEIAEFVRCARTGQPPETGGPEGRYVAAVLEAIGESAATGRTVDLRDVA